MLRLLYAALLLLAPLAACVPMPPDAPRRADRQGALTHDLRRLAARYPDATVAVAVRDAHTGVSVDLASDRLFHAASTMKLPVMIEVFRQAAAGRFSLDDSLHVENRFRSIVDGSPYRIEDDSDDAIYGRLGQRMAVRDLVYDMITISSNLAANLLIDLVSADSVQATIERLGTTRMRVLRGVEDIKAYRQGLNNTATAADLARLLEALARGAAVSPGADRAMVRILLAQRFDEMIPAGLPPEARTAHKTGWITAIHHDAALVFSGDQAPPYVLVVLTEGFAHPDSSAAFGAAIARRVHHALR